MTATPRSATSRMRVAAAALLLSSVLVAMMLTSDAMANLRERLPWLSNAMNWLEFLPVPFDMDHVVFFMGIVAAVRCLLPTLRWWWFMLAVGLLAGATELIQFWVPGRTPKWQDARDDMIGGALGLLIGTALLWVWRVGVGGVQVLARRMRRPAHQTGKVE